MVYTQAIALRSNCLQAPALQVPSLQPCIWLMSLSQGPACCPSAPSVLPVQRSPARIGHTLARRPLGMLRGQGVVSKACGNSSPTDAFPFLLDHAGVAPGLWWVVTMAVSPVGGVEMWKRLITGNLCLVVEVLLCGNLADTRLCP